MHSEGFNGALHTGLDALKNTVIFKVKLALPFSFLNSRLEGDQEMKQSISDNNMSLKMMILCFMSTLTLVFKNLTIFQTSKRIILDIKREIIKTFDAGGVRSQVSFQCNASGYHIQIFNFLIWK